MYGTDPSSASGSVRVGRSGKGWGEEAVQETMDDGYGKLQASTISCKRLAYLKSSCEASAHLCAHILDNRVDSIVLLWYLISKASQKTIKFA